MRDGLSAGGISTWWSHQDVLSTGCETTLLKDHHDDRPLRDHSCNRWSYGDPSGWSSIRVVSHQCDLSAGGLSTGWAFSRMVFQHGDLSAEWSFNRLSLTRVIFQQNGLSRQSFNRVVSGGLSTG